MKTDLAITGVGMLSPIGHSARVCMHSVRSAVSRLTVQGIPDRGKEPIVGGRILRWTRYIRERHLQALAEIALEQALRQARIANDDGSEFAVLLGAPEEIRPGVRFPAAGFDAAAWLRTQRVGRVTHVETLATGATSGHLGLHRAAQVLQAGEATACIIGAADSQLHLRITRWHEDNFRLKCAYMTDGLMPGEAACFLVVEDVERAQRRGASVIAHVLSIAGGREAATVLSDLPNTAATLTQAVRSALHDASVSVQDVGMVWCDLNGESYRAREWAFTEIRTGFGADTELVHPADCHGDVGAATGANLLGLAALCHGTNWSQGKPLLVVCGSEGGLRAAAVLASPQGASSLQVSVDLPRVWSTGFDLPSPPATPDDFRDLEDPPRAYFDWHLREEHRDELASLHYQRRAVLRDPTVAWPRLREVEQRMLNHLDAAVAGGPLSMAVVADGLSGDDEGLCFAGAFLIGTLPSEHNLELLDGAVKQPLGARLAGIETALVHAPDSAGLRATLLSWITASDSAVQALGVSVASRRRIEIGHQLAALASSTAPELLSAVADACRRLDVEEASAQLRESLNHERSDVRTAVAFALLRLEPGITSAHARSAMSTGFEPADALAICLGMAGHSSDVELLLSRLERRPDDLSVIEALGILGSAASVPHLLWLLDSPDDKVKEAAGNALDLMSGLHARERVMRFESDEWDEPREIEHVNTSSTFWTRWWHRQSGRLDRNRRWRRGEHLSIRSFIDELEDPSSSYFNRSRAYMELCLHASANIPFEADWFVRRQLIAINEWRAWWAEQERR